jgi:hypothetical protein
MIALSQVSRSFTVGDQQVAALRGIDHRNLTKKKASLRYT